MDVVKEEVWRVGRLVAGEADDWLRRRLTGNGQKEKKAQDKFTLFLAGSTLTHVFISAWSSCSD